MARWLSFGTATILSLATAVAVVHASGRPDDCRTPSWVPVAEPISRTDQQPSGNRVVAGCGPLDGVPIDVDLAGTPTWVLPDPTGRGTAWIVARDDGSVVRLVASAGDASSMETAPLTMLAPGEPPTAVARTDGESVVGSAWTASAWFDDPLPDARVVETPDAVLMALSEPTDRYPHAVLGDDLEASAVDIRAEDGSVTRIEVDAASVIEGLSPIVAQLDVDDVPEIIVTVSDSEVGARLVAYDLGGGRVAASEPIGRGFRWMHQIGVGPVGPEGQTEIIAVRTPHIGGVVEAYRLEEGQLRRVAAEPGYSSHRLGSANLDMALLADAHGDGRLEVLVPTQDMTSLALLTRVGDGFERTGSLPLDGRLVTNVAATPDAQGGLVFAVGTEDGRLRIFR